MTKRTAEEIRKDIIATYQEARYWYNISHGCFYQIRDFEAAEKASQLFRRVESLKMELNRAKIRDWGERAKIPGKEVK